MASTETKHLSWESLLHLRGINSYSGRRMYPFEVTEGDQRHGSLHFIRCWQNDREIAQKRMEHWENSNAST